VLIGDANDNHFIWNGVAGTAFDQVTGGGGSDLMDFSHYSAAGASTGLWVNLGFTYGAVAYSAGDWKPLAGLSGVENVQGSATGNTTFIGDANDNTFLFTGGTAQFTSGGGSDILDLTQYTSGSIWADLAYQPGSGSNLGGFQVWTSNMSNSLVQLLNVENVTATKTGNDRIIGDAIANVLTAGGGSDMLSGGGGADTFVFKSNWTHDTITDFTPSASGGVAEIVFAGVSGLTSFAQLTLTNVTGGVDVAYTTPDSVKHDIVLQGVASASSLTANDFLFH
jgi:Ca2+-binding RTX toxin-like protein